MEPKGKRDISSLALGQNFRDIPQLVPPAGQKRENRFVPAKTETSAGIFVLDRLGHRTLLPALDTTNFPTDTFPRVGFLRISNYAFGLVLDTTRVKDNGTFGLCKEARRALDGLGRHSGLFRNCTRIPGASRFGNLFEADRMSRNEVSAL